MSLMPSKEELELKLSVLRHEAEHKSIHETAQFIGLARFCHHLACQNTQNQLQPSSSGGVVIPATMMSQMAVGFAKDSKAREVFCVFMQPYLWEMIKNVPLEGVVLEQDSTSVLIRFKEMVIGEFKIPAMDLSLPIMSQAIWQKLNNGDIQLATIGGIIQDFSNSGAYSCFEIQAEPKPLLQDFYGKRRRHVLF